jgi:hypothetical protein
MVKNGEIILKHRISNNSNAPIWTKDAIAFFWKLLSSATVLMAFLVFLIITPGL